MASQNQNSWTPKVKQTEKHITSNVTSALLLLEKQSKNYLALLLPLIQQIIKYSRQQFNLSSKIMLQLVWNLLWLKEGNTEERYRKGNNPRSRF